MGLDILEFYLSRGNISLSMYSHNEWPKRICISWIAAVEGPGAIITWLANDLAGPPSLPVNNIDSIFALLQYSKALILRENYTFGSGSRPSKITVFFVTVSDKVNKKWHPSRYKYPVSSEHLALVMTKGQNGRILILS